MVRRLWDKVKFFYLRGSWNLWRGNKAEPKDFWGRCREVCADPSNRYIPRVPKAGKIVDGNLVMHNGLKVKMGEFAFYDDFARILLTTNRGVHEPQEERLFQEVLRHLPRNSTMIELGSYWAFYSMWFQSEIEGGNCYMIEPDEDRLECGRQNFRLNGMDGKFVQGKLGQDGMDFDDFIEAEGIRTVHLLHSDIQGQELNMLKSCKRAIAKNKIWYVVVSTHNQRKHYACQRFLENQGFVTLASVDFDHGTYCCDGILVARSAHVDGMQPMEVPLRRPNRPVVPGQFAGARPGGGTKPRGLPKKRAAA